MAKSDLRNVQISEIRENPVALRGVDRESAEFAQLRDSIGKFGILNPITVREKKDETDGSVYYEICDGLHRYSGAKDAGVTDIPVKVVSFDEAQTLEAQIVANLAKVDTKPVEYTKALQRMFTLNPLLTLTDMADKLSVSPAWITQRLGLLKLHDEVQKLVDEGRISLPNAYNLSKLPKEEQLNFIDGAMTQTAAEFAPTVTARVKALREAARQGKEATEPTFEPSAFGRKLSELKAENEKPSIGPALVAQTGITTAAQGFALGVQWALSIDPNSVEAQRAKWQAREDKKKADAAARAIEKADKKAQEAADAANKARAAAAASSGS
jgi:ParB/RepB/Spo0J family partition protein